MEENYSFKPQLVNQWLTLLMLLMSASLTLVFPVQGLRAQGLQLLPSSPGLGTTVSVQELQVPSKAQNFFRDGIKHLTKHDPAGSLPYFDKAIQNSPGYYQAYYHLGIAQLQLGRKPQALEAFQRSVDLSGGHYVRAIFGCALVLTFQGKAREAEPIVRRAIQQDSTVSDGPTILAFVLLKQHRLDEAESIAIQAVQLRDVGSWKGYLVLADIHAERGDYQMEIKDLETYVRLEPSATNRQYAEDALSRLRRLANELSAKNGPPH